MGIQRFTARVAHKGEDIWLGKLSNARSDPDQSETQHLPRSAIIDGPSLAYHIYNNAVKDSGYDARPYAHAYDILVVKFLAFLDRLTEFGLRIEHIYFDGGLPVSKIETRTKRMEQTLQQVQAIEQVCKDATRIQHGKRAVWSSAFRKAISRSASMPAPNNMIAIIIEGLLNSKYSETARVVPGEADGWLASSAQELAASPGEVFILSNDSDMLVYPLEKNVKVLLPSSVLMYDGSAKVTVFCSAQISQSIGIDNLLKAAYNMEQDHHCSLETASRKAVSGSGLSDFVRQYNLPDENKLVLKSHKELFFQRMDPVVAEIVEQIRADHGREASQLQVYLKPMIGDPTQKSAWRISEDIRILAYSILLAEHKKRSEVHEFDRKGTKIGIFKLPLIQDLQHHLESFVEWLDETIALHGDLKDGCLMWRLTSMTIVLRACQTVSDLPAVSTIHQVIVSDWPESWTQFYLQAQLDATLASFRMLKQIMEYVWAGYQDQAHSHEAPPSFLQLRELLQSLPCLKEILSVDQNHVSAKLPVRVQSMMEIAISQLDTDATSSESEMDVDSRDQDDIDELASRAFIKTASGLSTNPFDMLSV